jgi:hypothetical protein
VFLDTAGWLAIEDAARAFRAHLTARIRAESLHLSPRLGPGHLDWSLTEQAEFFSLFAGHIFGGHSNVSFGLPERRVLNDARSSSSRSWPAATP